MKRDETEDWLIRRDAVIDSSQTLHLVRTHRHGAGAYSLVLRCQAPVMWQGTAHAHGSATHLCYQASAICLDCARLARADDVVAVVRVLTEATL